VLCIHGSRWTEPRDRGVCIYPISYTEVMRMMNQFGDEVKEKEAEEEEEEEWVAGWMEGGSGRLPCSPRRKQVVGWLE